MRFDYTLYEGNRMPLVPVVFKHKNSRLPPIGALVDTGATHTILPLEIATELDISVDLEDRLESQVAGGGLCFIYPSPVPIGYLLRDSAGHSEYQWHGQVFFAPGQPLVLLGHHQCLEKFDLTFKGPEKTVEMTPRSPTEAIGRTKQKR